MKPNKKQNTCSQIYYLLPLKYKSEQRAIFAHLSQLFGSIGPLNFINIQTIPSLVFLAHQKPVHSSRNHGSEYSRANGESKS